MKIILLILLLGYLPVVVSFTIKQLKIIINKRCYENAKKPELREYCSDITDKKYEGYQTQRQEVINE